MNEPSIHLRRLVAAAVLQRVRWGDHTVDVPLARPVRADPDEVVLRMAEGGWLVLAMVPTATAVRAALRRWMREAEDGPIQAILLTPDHVADELLAEPPERPGRRLRVGLAARKQSLWDDQWPVIADVLEEAANRRLEPPPDVMEKLHQREGVSWPERAAPPRTPSFERLVFALAQAHDLVRLVRGEARLRLRSGGHLTVLAGAGDPSIDHPALAAALARIAAGLAQDDPEVGLIVVDGPNDLLDRVSSVVGQAARTGRVWSVSGDGAVRPPDRDLAELVELARRWEGPTDLWACLDAGLARARGTTFSREISTASEARLGLVRGLLERLPGARLEWIEGATARVNLEQREIRVGFVGPEGGPVHEVVGAWRLAALGARWTGHTVDLLLAGGDDATWERARRDLPPVPEGHVFHLAGSGQVRTQAGVFGRLQRTARALRALGRLPEAARRCSLEDLRRQVEHLAVADFRAAVADAEFQRKLMDVPPWATRASLGALAVAYALQLRWDASAGAAVVRMGALTGEGLGNGEPWRWLAAAFLHAGWWHIGLNALALWVLGRRLEAMLGPHRLVILFVLSCAGGSMLHEAFSATGDVAVGASTGILGLLAAQGALVLLRRDLVPPRIRRLLWREAWINGLIILAVSLLPFVGGLAHLGGALVGFALVATGLLTLGVAPGEPTDEGPTRITTPQWLRGVAVATGAIAGASLIAAIAIGRPWEIGGPGSYVVETELADGRVVLPIPKAAGPAEIRIDPDQVVYIDVGDPLRDGLRIEARAWSHGLDEPPDLDQIAALRGPAGVPWERRRAGAGAALGASLRPPAESWWDVFDPPDRLARRRWLLVRGGVIVDLRVTGSLATPSMHLGGSWQRIPAGVDADAAAFGPVRPTPDLAALQAALRGRPPGAVADPDLRGVLRAVAAEIGGDRDAARDLADEALVHAEGRTWVTRLAHVIPVPAATLLVERALSHATDAEKPLLELQHAQSLEREDRFDEALTALGDRSGGGLDLVRAQMLWHAGRDAEAAEAARAWRDVEEPWWLRPATETPGTVPPSFEGQRGWARFLEGDVAGCIRDSESARREQPDLVIAAYNEALCTLALRGPSAAEPRYADAHELALELGFDLAREGAARDLRTLIRRDTRGAEELYETYFADLTPAGAGEDR